MPNEPEHPEAWRNDVATIGWRQVWWCELVDEPFVVQFDNRLDEFGNRRDEAICPLWTITIYPPKPPDA